MTFTEGILTEHFYIIKSSGR